MILFIHQVKADEEMARQLEAQQQRRATRHGTVQTAEVRLELSASRSQFQLSHLLLPPHPQETNTMKAQKIEENIVSGVDARKRLWHKTSGPLC